MLQVDLNPKTHRLLTDAAISKGLSLSTWGEQCLHKLEHSPREWIDLRTVEDIEGCGGTSTKLYQLLRTKSVPHKSNGTTRRVVEARDRARERTEKLVRKMAEDNMLTISEVVRRYLVWWAMLHTGSQGSDKST